MTPDTPGKPRPGTAIVAADRTVPVEFVGKIDANYYCRAWNAKRKKYCRARAGSGTTHPGVNRCHKHGGTVEGDGRHETATHGKHRRYAGMNAPRIQALIEQYRAMPDPFDVRDDLVVARALMHDWLERYAEFTAALTAWYDTWEGKYAPLAIADRNALVEVLQEHQANLREIGGTTEQWGQLSRARAAVDFLALPQVAKPRHVLDVSDAMSHVDTISKVIHRAEQIRQHGAVSIERIRLFLLGIDRVLELELLDHELRQRVRKGISAVRV
jgi:hypothetical protein